MPSADLPLPHGGTIRIRLATPEDAPVLEAGFAHLSDDSRYTRFFTAMPKLPAAMLGRLTDLDGVSRLAIAAFDPTRASEVGTSDGYGIGVARWVRGDDSAGAPELAMTIIDEYHRLGIGRILLDSLVVAAHSREVPSLVAYVLTSNVGMLHLLWSVGAVELEGSNDPAVLLFEVDIERVVHEHLDPARRAVLEPVLAPVPTPPARRA